MCDIHVCKTVLFSLRNRDFCPDIKYLHNENYWKKETLLGRGQFAEVFLYKHIETQLNIAVKQVKYDPDDDEKFSSSEEWRNEINLLETLSHARIVKFLGYFMDCDNYIWSICLEHLSRGSLYKLLGEGPLNLRTTIQYTQQLLEGVEYLHTKRVIHRDIKSKNILLVDTSNIKIADFSISKQIETLSSTHGAKTSGKGSVYWMAPEVCSEKDYGEKIDIWSIGCTVVEMLTTKPPWYEFKEAVVVLNKIINCEYPIYTLPENLCMEVEKFLRLCFQKDPKQRLSATELLSANLFKVPEGGEIR